jgi:formate dehydrogenase major subunit
MARNLTRLTEPLVRENDMLRPATWDEALDRAAAGISSAVAAGGPNALGIFSCSKASNEVNFVAQKFARVAVGTNNIDSCNRT